MSETPIDAAHAAMSAAPEDEAARLAFYDRVAEAELHLMLDREAEGDRIAPRLFEVDGLRYALAFDLPERLTAFTGEITPYAGLSGRALAGLLAGEGLGLGINLEVAPSGMLLPPDAVTWLAETLSGAPEQTEARIAEIGPPGAVPPALLSALDRKLATAGGRARAAYLASAVYAGGERGTLLAFLGTVDGAERALAGALREALVFSGLDAGALDVAFLPDGGPVSAALERHGLRVDLPEPEQPVRLAPGSDPDTPPRLR